MDLDQHNVLACLTRLGQLQRDPVDKVALQEAISSAAKEAKATAQMKHIAQSLHTPKPLFLNQPDVSKLPAILVSQYGKWDILRGKNSHDQWVCESFDSENNVWEELTLDDLHGHCLVQMRLSAPFTASNSPVFKLIKSEVFGHKRLLFEALLASITINIVALASAFYTMQGYRFRTTA